MLPITIDINEEDNRTKAWGRGVFMGTFLDFSPKKSKYFRGRTRLQGEAIDNEERLGAIYF